MPSPLRAWSPADERSTSHRAPGKVAADLHASAAPGGEVLGVDISPGMIGIARQRFAGRPGLAYVVGDAMALPADDDRFDAATIAFGMRNLPDYSARLLGDGARRAARGQGRLPGDRPAAQPAGPDHALVVRPDRAPHREGRGQGSAYAYLVRSVQNYPAPERIAEVMREAGLVGVRWIGMSGGIVTIHVGMVPPRES